MKTTTVRLPPINLKVENGIRRFFAKSFGSAKGPLVLKYPRILVKFSGEALGNRSDTISAAILRRIAAQIALLRKAGIEVVIVLGGGNIFRGLAGSKNGIDRVKGDHMGMLATVINSIALQDALESIGVPAVVMTATSMPGFGEHYVCANAMKHISEGLVVIFGGGTGNSYFSTDTAAALRANEIKADVIIKATKVDGIYDSDPKLNSRAKRFARISHRNALRKELKVMDSTAFSLCMDNKKPIIVCNPRRISDLLRIALGDESNCTVVETN
ncbi:MAG: uridylate kinase [Candidatus Taylorbacteria bacterium]|nr:uridylate kinase [Candidatus Taylorbacteria bacterium]